jgi:hypothetical protein
MTASEMYWIMRLDQFKALVSWLLLVLPILIFLVLAFYQMLYSMLDTYERKEMWYNKRTVYKVYITALVLITIGFVIQTFLPSTKDMLIIQGIDRISNSPEINNLVGLLYEKLQTLLTVGK